MLWQLITGLTMLLRKKESFISLRKYAVAAADRTYEAPLKEGQLQKLQHVLW